MEGLAAFFYKTGIEKRFLAVDGDVLDRQLYEVYFKNVFLVYAKVNPAALSLNKTVFRIIIFVETNSTAKLTTLSEYVCRKVTLGDMATELD